MLELFFRLEGSKSRWFLVRTVQEPWTIQTSGHKLGLQLAASGGRAMFGVSHKTRAP